MNCPDAKNWELLSMELLSEDKAQALREHLNECPQCSEVWQRAAGRHRDLQAAFQAFGLSHDQRREQLMAMLPPAAPQPAEGARVAAWRRWLEKGAFAMILRGHKNRWAAAASLAAACVAIAVFLFSGNRGAFAEVLENMRQAKTMVCDVVTSMELTKNPTRVQFPGIERKHRGRMSMYQDGDTRAVLNVSEAPESYLTVGQIGAQDEQSAPVAKETKLPESKVSTMRTLFVGDKAYTWHAGKLRVLTSLGVQEQPGPEQWLGLLLQARVSPDRELGEERIQGRVARGFEIAGWKLAMGTRPTAGGPTPVDSSSKIRVWVDSEQNLPVRIEVDAPLVSPQMEGVVHTRYENIRWNVPLDAADFQPPSQAELSQAEVHELPAVDEATFVQFMKSWVDAGKQAHEALEVLRLKEQEKGEKLPPGIVGALGGDSLEEGYPKQLDMNWLSGAYLSRLTLIRVVKSLTDQPPLPTGLEESERQRLIAERAEANAKAMSKIGEDAMVQATAAAAFYQRLANDGREPEYSGATVSPGDAGAVLLEWKLDDGRRRVLYGDLRSETVGAGD
ncbi:MAG: hypothetical protein KDA37_02605 [Planctomycetales bacterium]|nr:hypothetical protein [Planctomycetales bacterium]